MGIYSLTFINETLDQYNIYHTDIVFVRTWYPVSIPKFCNPVTSLLLPNEAKFAWEGMKTVGQLRKAEGTKAAVKQDSIYKVMT